MSIPIDTALFDAFIERQGLPQRFRGMAETYYVPVARWLARTAECGECFLFGINGGQGTGKSTLAAFLKMVLCEKGLRVVALSIDDFYLTRSERDALARDVHALLATRGVPGTHDVGLLARCLSELKSATTGATSLLPQFSKADDDRAVRGLVFEGPVDIVLLEGWCVGTPHQPEYALNEPINKLEQDCDRDGRWRRWVNDQLRERYAVIWAQLNAMLYLQAPSFEAVYRWRVKQERKLRAKSGHRDGRFMSDQQLATFVEHFERLTRSASDTLPQTADVVLRLDEQHMCIGAQYRNEGDV